MRSAAPRRNGRASTVSARSERVQKRVAVREPRLRAATSAPHARGRPRAPCPTYGRSRPSDGDSSERPGAGQSQEPGIFRREACHGDRGVLLWLSGGGMATERERNRSRERLKRLSRSKLDRESIQYETI